MVETNLLTPDAAYEHLSRGELVTLRFADGTTTQSVKIDGMVWLSGHHKPLQIISSRSRRYALGENDHVERLSGF